MFNRREHAAMRVHAVEIPLSEEEHARLSELAAAEGATVPEYVRLCVFGPVGGDPADAVARPEGVRIRGARGGPLG